MARLKRRLADLFVVGKEVVFDDGEGEPVTVYVRKLNATEHDRAMRRSNGARATVLAAKRDPESDEYKNNEAMVYRYDEEALLDYLVGDEEQRRIPIVNELIADEDEWKDDTYLQGLFEAWGDGLETTYAEDPDDAEAKRVFDEMKRYSDQCEAAVKAEMADFRRSLEDHDLAKLREKVLDKVFDLASNIAWLDEYRKCELWQSVRELDKKTHYFESRDDVDLLPSEVIGRLGEAYRELAVEPLEGKSSPATDTSSPSSDPAASTETEPSSGPAIVAA